jgi:hypothetical protein
VLLERSARKSLQLGGVRDVDAGSLEVLIRDVDAGSLGELGMSMSQEHLSWDIATAT